MAPTGGSGSITNNIITINSASTAYAMYGIRLQAGLASSTINVNNNTIQNSTCNTVTSSTNAAGFYGIQATPTMTGTTIGTININYNKIKGNYIGGATLTTATDYLITLNGGTFTNANIIGDTMINNSFGIASSANTGNMAAIYTTGATITNCLIRDNIIDSFARVSTSGGNSYGISSTSGTAYNYVKHNSIKNIIQDGNAGTACITYGINLGATADLQVDSNIVSNIINKKATGTSSIYGISQQVASATSEKYRYNSISNLTSLGATPMTGMYFTTSAGTREISYDTITNITSLGAVSNYGILSGTATSTIKNNTIYNIGSTGTGTTAVSAGINVSSGNADIYNNMISDIRANATSTAVKAAVGIIAGNATASSIRYNTIYLNNSQGTVLTANACATGVSIESGTSIALNLQNNIINNQYVASGTGIASAIRRSSSGSNGVRLTNVTFGNNIYYVPNGTNNFIYAEGNTTASNTNSYFVNGVTAGAGKIIDSNFNTTCGIYRTWNVDTSSYTENNLSGTTPVYIPTLSSYAQKGGLAIGAITTDYYGVARDTADIGAIQFAGAAMDIKAPVINVSGPIFPALSSVICSPTNTISITDATSGVQATAGTRPRIYFKKGGTNANANIYATANNSTVDGWKWVEATNAVSPFSFTLDYTLLFGGLPVIGDSIVYFIVAQDSSSNTNTSINGASLANGICPKTVSLSATAFPIANYTYGFAVTNLPTSITTTISSTILCANGPVTLGLNAVGGAIAGSTVQWQSSPAGANTFTDLVGGTTQTFTTPTLTTATDFRCVIKDCKGNVISISPSPTVSVIIASPSVLTTKDSTRCGTGTVQLNATASAGATLNWYATLQALVY